MIILDTTAKSLQIFLSGAVATTQVPFVVSYADHIPATPAFTPGENDGTTNNTTAVTIAAAPAAGAQRQVKQISIWNADTAPATVTVRLVNGANNRNLMVATLQVGERIEYEECQGFAVYTSLGAKKVTAVASYVEPGYIDGMRMIYTSTNSITVSSGTAYIPSAGYNVNFNSSILKSGLSLSASTWYHVYAFLNAGVPDVEVVTTSPSAPYNGTARTKTGDTTRRYVGSVVTNASSQIVDFDHNWLKGEVMYRLPGVIFRVLSNGSATTSTIVSCSSAIPPTSRAPYARFLNLSGSANFIIGPGDAAITTTDYFLAISFGGQAVVAFVPTDSSQQLRYFMSAASTGAYIDVYGFAYER